MDRPASSLDFAVIGHQDTWANISAFVNSIRKPEQERLSLDKIKNIFPFIPPRDLFRVLVRSKTGAEINGIYIDTFIEPDKLGVDNIRSNINKVNDAITCAKRNQAKIVSLGGFTSIVLEGNLDSCTNDETNFTTGNTLTTAFIVKGIEKAAAQRGLEMEESMVLIIGATGDIGMACVNYLKTKTRKLLLCARNQRRLKNLSDQLSQKNITNDYSTSIDDLIPEADIVICAASSSGLELNECKKDVIICDAGYPKNLDTKIEKKVNLIFHGGMGQVAHGYEFDPDYTASFYQYPAPFVIHGCILESMILAFEMKFENYSAGKGNISVDKIEEIYNLGLKHGIDIAPFYNSKGLC